jgi:hypothetical protein
MPATARLQPDLLESRGEVVVGKVAAVAAQRLREADRELAPAAEPGDGLTQLLNAAEAGIAVADLDEQADHPRIVGGLGDQLNGIEDVARIPEQAEQIGRACLGWHLAEIDR